VCLSCWRDSCEQRGCKLRAAVFSLFPSPFSSPSFFSFAVLGLETRARQAFCHLSYIPSKKKSFGKGVIEEVTGFLDCQAEACGAV
jgi:hypothetical protein